MNILFLHKNFPAQFKYLATYLAHQPDNNVTFITSNDDVQIDKIKKVVYKPARNIPEDCHPYLRMHEEAIIHGQAASSAALFLKNDPKFKPDVIYTHQSGPGLFMKYMIPDVPIITYCEWYYRAEGADIGFDGNPPDIDTRAKLRCSNSNFLIDLYSCDAFVSPTYWQKSQFPKEFHHKIQVIHDGIDTDRCKPDENATFLIKDKNLTLTAKDEVLTYGTRGMEPYRGFIEFMEAAEYLLKKRPNLHIIIAGEDITCYGKPLENETYKELALRLLDFDMNRLHFVGKLNFIDYVKMLQISSAHVYSTYPYILSWSLLDAMATGCCIVASNTAPVLEVMKDNYNGLLFDFYNQAQLAQKVEYALDNQDKMETIRQNARQTVLDNYKLENMLAAQISYINNVIAKHKQEHQL